MTDLCSNVSFIAEGFLWSSLVFAIVETTLALSARYLLAREVEPKSRSRLGLDPEAWAKFLEALSKALIALKDLPAWVAIFLAGLALLWSSGSIAKLCV